MKKAITVSGMVIFRPGSRIFGKDSISSLTMPVLRQIMRFYVWVVRGTPLLVQLFVVFYGLPSLGIILTRFRRR